MTRLRHGSAWTFAQQYLTSAQNLSGYVRRPVLAHSIVLPALRRTVIYLLGVRIGLTSCSFRSRLISLNHGPATLIHSLPSEAWAVAATWAKAVCSFASSG